MAAALSCILWALGSRHAIADRPHGLNLWSMDRNVTVQKPSDLYDLANGKWLDNINVPADKAYVGTVEAVNENNFAILKTIAEQALLRKAPKDSSDPADIVGWFYRLAMDERRLNAMGGQPLVAQLKRIDLVHDRASLVNEIAHLQAIAVHVGFDVSVRSDYKDSSRLLITLGQGGLTLPERDLYFDQDDRAISIRAEYRKTMTNLLKLAKLPYAAEQAENALTLESILAKAASSPVELRDPRQNYNLTTVEELKASTPSVAWNDYFAALGTNTPVFVNLCQPKAIRAFARALKDQPITVWKSYLRAVAIYNWAPYLSDDFVNAQFGLIKVLTGVQELLPRWKRALQATDAAVGDALGQLFVAKAFSPLAKEKALQIVRNVRLALRERIGDLEWMSPATQNEAIKKLDSLNVKIGYPGKWKQYSGFTVRRDSYVVTVMNAKLFEWNQELKKLGKPVDRSEWATTAITVSAFYNPYWNEIVFPAGILQPGFFDPAADDASNYGAIGSIIGHEITHGFDDQGCLFDAQGNLRNWWTPEDKMRFDDEATTIVKQYGGYTSAENLSVNGKLTLSENIADVGGLTIAYLAYHKALAGDFPFPQDGLTCDQRFFIAFAQNYRAHYRPEQAKVMISTDPHSPDAIRVEGAAADQFAFYKAFGLKVPLHLPHVW
jgi:putative endopeptidase